MPQSNVDYWKPKLERNVKRDAEKDEALRKLGWRVMVVWECDIKAESSVTDVVETIKREIRN